MTQKLMSHFSDVMSTDIDEGNKVTHEQLGERIEQQLEDPKFWRKMDGDGFETGFGDWCYSPIIQSGGNYDLKSSAQTDDQRLKAGVILCSLGIRYKSYCSNVGRTFMIDPDAVSGFAVPFASSHFRQARWTGGRARLSSDWLTFASNERR